MTIHPSTFPKRADGTRFYVCVHSGGLPLVMSDNAVICTCPSERKAEMIVAALEQVARDGETFDSEEKP